MITLYKIVKHSDTAAVSKKRDLKKEASCGNNGGKKKKKKLEEEYRLGLNLGFTALEFHTSSLTHLGCI